MHRSWSLLLGAALLVAPAARAQQPAGPGKPFTAADLDGWKNIRSAAVSTDGKWLAYQLAPNEGDASVVVRSTGADGREWTFPIGEPPAAGGGGGGGGQQGGATANTALAFSGDGKWVAFSVYPTRREAQRLRRERRPVQGRLALVSLASGDRKEFDKVRRFVFSGDRPRFLAMHGYGADSGAAARVAGADLVLHDLGTSELVNIGNVAEFAFDFSGEWLAYAIDARDRIGNGVQLRNTRTDVVRVLDSERALYRRLAWADSGLAIAVLRGRPDSAAADTFYSLVAMRAVGTPAQKKLVFEAAGRADFPAGMAVSPERAPRWSEDFAAVFFGIREAKKPRERGPTYAAGEQRAGGNGQAGQGGGSGSEPRMPAAVRPGAPGEGGARNQPTLGNENEELPSLVLWHWKDPRLQSQQIVEEQRDRTYSYLSAYRVAEDRFLRLANDSLRTVTIAPRDRFAFATDVRKYEQAASYNGRRYVDLYTIDLRTGQTRLALEQSTPFTSASPDGTKLLVWGIDGHYHAVDLATGAKRNITQGVQASFVDTEDDHNNAYPQPQNSFGWAKDGSAVLLSDGWDVWRVPVAGGQALALTTDGRKTKTRYLRRYTFDPRARGVDLAQPLYFATYGEWTKKEGLARVDGRKGGAARLVEDDAKIAFTRAREADVFLFTRQTAKEFPDWHLAGADFRSAKKLTDANPQQAEFAFTSGARLVDYVSDKGDTLQAALYLPASYQPGKKYPTMVYIYERLSQNLHAYSQPNGTRALNPSVYTSRGYAVLMPDIAYKVNDPGMSAVWSVLPAVKAAVATGIVDSAKVGLHGHSWGGYQTAFLVTQTDLFKAAIAGAPLTDLVSMYSSIYWNTGGTNQAIFESSQGRFRGNFADNLDAYVRNSPAFAAKNVKTPLVILHNDKDGAVDFNQGITFYNTLRQMGKDVILFEYVGENHGLARPQNQKDYAVRMREYFDHHLVGAPAPEWLEKGVPRLKMEEHLRARRETPAPRPQLVP